MRQGRIIAALLAALLLLLAGCQERGAELELDIEAAAETILEEVAFQNQLIRATGDAVKSYYNMNDAVADHAIYIDGSGGSAEEVAVIEAVDEASADRVRAIVDARLDELAWRFEDYQPREMVKINDPVIEVRGRYVILVVCDDPGAADGVVSGLFDAD